MLSNEKIQSIGFASVGIDVKISENAKFYNPEKIRIGNNVRIDDFCIISAGDGYIDIGNYIHIATHSCIFGSGGVTMEDFSGLSSRVIIYSVSDDYSGTSLTNPTIPAKFRNIDVAPVKIGKHVIVGAGAVILPGVHIGTGAAIGALSLVKADCQEFGIYFGAPAKKIAERSRQILEQEKTFLASLNAQ
jgi:galactoside O-acetyltransferase